MTTAELDIVDQFCENSSEVGQLNTGVDSLFVGKIFSSLEEAFMCYQNYAAENGFSIKKRSTYKRMERSNDITGALFTCLREGAFKAPLDFESQSVVRRKRATIKTGCQARMTILALKDSQWKVTIFDDAHNHTFVSPTKRILMKSRKYLPQAAKDLSESFRDEHVQINKVTGLFGGRVNASFTDKDLWNHLVKQRNKVNNSGDADAVRRYFQQMGQLDKGFYYAIDTDEDGRAMNFFWVGARSRWLYQHFGDAVTFDTYRTNKYSMLFGPFTGVNHHGQNILFGCALLENETEDTFKWVFRHWLRAMEGKHPSSIITDQDKAMTSAIADVFPNTYHRYCLWHIMKKFPEHFSHLYHSEKDFKKLMNKAIYDSVTIGDFEDQWKTIVERYKLQDNTWTKSLYEIRQKWIPIYCRSTFFGGMNTTQRSESMNAFFDGFVRSHTTLKEFVMKYDHALESMDVKERKEDFFSKYKTRQSVAKVGVLLHAEQIYTRTIFNKIEIEFNNGLCYKAEKTKLDGDVQSYVVRRSTREHVVKINLSTHEGSCCCQLFEFQGFPCGHLIQIFAFNLYLDEIPAYFILERWTKDALKGKVGCVDSLMIENPHIGEHVPRVSTLFKYATKSFYRAAASQEAFDVCMEHMKKMSEAVSLVDEKVLRKNNLPVCTEEDTSARIQKLLLDPNISQTKGRKRTNLVLKETEIVEKFQGTVEGTQVQILKSNARIMSGLEKATQSKKARACGFCLKKDVGHDTRNCPDKLKKSQVGT